jgi:hypothetical protein
MRRVQLTDHQRQHPSKLVGIGAAGHVGRVGRAQRHPVGGVMRRVVEPVAQVRPRLAEDLVLAALERHLEFGRHGKRSHLPRLDHD